jgi:hypothetical protein
MPLTREDQVLDRIWRARFGQPMPITGSGEAVRIILIKSGVTKTQIEAAMRLSNGP